MTPTEWLTIGLVVFAGVQVLIQYRDFRERRRQHDRVESQRIDQARTNLTVEWYRMRRIAQQWNGVDLVQGAEVGQLYPEEILPRDRGALVADIARLGETSTFLVMESLDKADNAAKLAQQVAAMAGRFMRAEQSPHPTPPEHVAIYRKSVDAMAATIQLFAIEATNCLEDAIANSPGGAKPMLTAIKPNPVSQSGQKLVLAFEEQQQRERSNLSLGQSPLTDASRSYDH